jgi:ketosteroid isomerase-like protein
MPTAEPAAASAAAEFVERFAAAWAEPSPERLGALGHTEVVLIQPAMRRMEGREQARRGFAKLFAVWPDLRAEVDRWSATGDYVFIDFRLRATVARRPFEWPVVDRILLEDGLVRERVSYFDPLPLMLESLKRPSKLPAMLRLMRRT